MSDDTVPPDGDDLGPLSEEERELVKMYRELAQAEGYRCSGAWVSVMLESPRPDGMSVVFRHKMRTDSALERAKAQTALAAAAEYESGRIMREVIQHTDNPALMRAQLAQRVSAPGGTSVEAVEAMGQASRSGKKPH